MDDLRTITTGLAAAGESAIEPHPPPGDLRAVALGAPVSPELARHLDTCAVCALEVDVWKRGPARTLRGPGARPARDPGIGARRFRPTRIAALVGLAAGIVVGLALGALWPRRTAPPEWAPSGGGGMNGPVQLLLLRAPLRGDGPIPTLRVDPSRSTCLFALEAQIPDRLPLGAPLRFVLSRDPGGEVWSARTTAGWTRATMEASGVATVAVPTAALAQGGYSMRLVSEDASAAAPIVDIRFRLAIAPP